MRYTKIDETKKISYHFQTGNLINEINVIRNPKLCIQFDSIVNLSVEEFLEILNTIIVDLKVTESICLEFTDDFEQLLKYMIVVNESEQMNNIIFKINESNITTIDQLKSFITVYHLPVIINYIVSPEKNDLEHDLQILKRISELYTLDDSIDKKFKLHYRNMERITITKELVNGVKDDPFTRSTFMYYLDRFKLKTYLVGDESAIKLWQTDIINYYSKKTMMSHRRELKVV